MLIRSTWTLKIREETLLPFAYTPNLIKLLYAKMGIDFTNEFTPNLTFSGIVGKISKTDDFLHLTPENEYQLSLAGLEINASKAIKKLELNEKIEFLGITFEVINREDKITTYEEMYSLLVAEEPEAIRDYQLEFLTPTAFAQNKVNLPLPIPHLMFRSWLERWNHFSNIYLGGNELIEYLKNNSYLAYLNLNSRRVQINQNKITGFVGTINLKIPQRIDDLLANVVNLLFHYSEYAGTGIKTRLGMGNTLLCNK